MRDLLLCPLSTRKNKGSKQSVFLKYCATETPCLFLSDFHSKTNVCLSGGDSYLSCVPKVLNSFEYLSRLPFDWFLFCDDDTFVNEKKIKEFLVNCNHRTSYGHILDCETDPKNPIWKELGKDFKYFSGGAGFIVPKQIIKTLSTAPKKEASHCRFSDVAVGLIYKSFNLPMVHNDRFNPLCCLSYPKKNRREQITYHYMTEAKMKEVSNEN